MSTAIPARTSPRASVDHPEVELQRLEASEPLLNAEDDTTVAEMTPKTKSAWGDRRETIATYLILVGCVVVTLPTWFLILTGDLSAMGWFMFHPIWQTLSMVGLVYGITPIQPPTPSSATERRGRFVTHQNIVLRCTVPFMLTGSAAVWWNKVVHSKDHFTTWHAWFGLASTLMMTAQAGMGMCMAWYGKELFGSEAQAKKMYKYHRLSGYILAGLVLVTIHLAGAYSHWATRNAGPFLRAVAYWLGPLAIAVGLAIGVQPSKMKFI